MHGVLDGVVEDFDEARGLGTVASGDRRYPFHCTQLADGTRTVEVGTTVTFEVTAAHLGRWEATRIHKR